MSRRLGRAHEVGLVAVVAVVSAATAACPSPGARAPGDVLLVSVDTLRADHVGAYGYARATTPHVDAFFRRGRIYEHAYATASYTPPSVVSLLSGRLPPEHGVFDFFQLVDRRLPLVCDLLRERYQSAAVVSNASLTREAIGIGDCFDDYDDYVDELEGPVRRIFERSARRTTDAALAWLRRRDPGRPSLLWVHYIDPHAPYRVPPGAEVSFGHEGSLPVDPQRIPAYARVAGSDALDYVDRYDEEIAYTDAEIGRLLAGFTAASDEQRALVILVADHGECLVGRSSYFDHGFQVFEELIRVPLMIVAPGVSSGRVDSVVSIVDVLPTILAFAGVPAPDGLPGRDLLAAPPPGERIVYAESPEWAAAVRGRRKWTARLGARRRVVERRFYDLEADPGERDPGTWGTDDAGPQFLEQVMRGDPRRRKGGARVRRGRQLAGPKISPRANEAQLEQLRGLGYVE